MSDEIRNCFDCMPGSVELKSWIPPLMAIPLYCVVCDSCGVSGPASSSGSSAIESWNEMIDAVSWYRASQAELKEVE